LSLTATQRFTPTVARKHVVMIPLCIPIEHFFQENNQIIPI